MGEDTQDRHAPPPAPPVVVDPATGHMTLWGMPAWIMSPQYYAEMQAELEMLSGKAARGVLYRVAFRSGARAAEGIARATGPARTDEEKAAELHRLVALAFAAGHGLSALSVGDVANRDLTWVIGNSWLAALHAPAKDAVCHYYEGFLAGYAATILGTPVEVREIECRAKGDARCKFRTRAAASSPV